MLWQKTVIKKTSRKFALNFVIRCWLFYEQHKYKEVPKC